VEDTIHLDDDADERQEDNTLERKTWILLSSSSSSSSSSECTDLDSQGPLPREPADLHLPLPQRDGGQYDKSRCSDGCLPVEGSE
jgi:hypothetical protein